MKGSALRDIGLTGYTLQEMDLLRRLREGLLKKRAEVCIERAVFITQYLRDLSSDADPVEIKYAKAVSFFLANKAPLFFDDSLLAGTTTSKPFGAPLYPEFTGMTIWPELDTISTRNRNPLILSSPDARTLNRDIFPWWMERNILEYTRKKYGNPGCLKLFERLVFFISGKAGCISHTVPDYRTALEKGIGAMIRRAAEREREIRSKGNVSGAAAKKIVFYQAAQIAMKGIIAYARNLSAKASELAEQEQESWRRENLRSMAAVCARVPEKPARTFREAVNALWIIQVAIHAENINMAVSPGRLDQVLYKYYRRDMDRGTLTVRDAVELMGCLWLKLNDNTSLVPEASEELFGGAGTVPAVTVGGVDSKGENAVNELTYIILRVAELLMTRDPSINARYHVDKNPREYRGRVAEVIAGTRAVPALHNDVVDIEVLKNQGVASSHANDYAIIGCVELTSAGRSYDASSSIMLNMAAVLEMALFNGKRPVTGDEQIGPRTGDPDDFRSFEEFWEAFKAQFAWLAGKAIELNEYFGSVYQEILPTPLLSSFIEGPVSKGRDLIFGGARYNSSGATHIGFADTVDSLNAIEAGIFRDRTCTFAELLAALKDDFEGQGKLRAYLINKTPKYGTGNPFAVKNAQNMVRFIYDFYQGHRNYRGGVYRPAYWTMTNHAGQGKFCGALPNGRKAGAPLASGITPVSQAAGSLSSCLKAVAGLDSLCMPGGEAFNLKFPSLRGKKDLDRFAQTIEAYFRLGGLHIQFNIMSYETLLDAKNNPDKYPELLVRVSGYSAYFRDLNAAMQDEIITRTEYDLAKRQAVQFPGPHSSPSACEGN